MCPWYDPGYIFTDPASHSQSAQKIFRIYFRKLFRNISKPEIFRIYFQKHFRNISKPEIFRNILRNVSKYIVYAKSFKDFACSQDLSKDCATINLLMYETELRLLLPCFLL